MKQKYRPDRLLKLAEFLEERVPTRAFDYGVVVHFGEHTDPMKVIENEGKCGTQACAMGWMPAVFPRTFKWSTGYGTIAPGAEGQVQNRINGQVDWYAMTDFFGISMDEAHFLFMPEWWGSITLADKRYSNDLPSKARAKTVARHIRRFVELKKKDAAGQKKQARSA